MFFYIQLGFQTCLERLESEVDDDEIVIRSRVPKYDYCHISDGVTRVKAILDIPQISRRYELASAPFNGSRGALNEFEFPLMSGEHI